MKLKIKIETESYVWMRINAILKEVREKFVNIQLGDVMFWNKYEEYKKKFISLDNMSDEVYLNSDFENIVAERIENENQNDSR